MNNLRNRVNLIGNIGIDPQVREVQGGKKMARFTLATKDTYRNNDGEKVTETQWHNIITWGAKAVFAEKYLRAGQEVAIEGKLNHREYTDEKGDRRFYTEVVANDMLILRSRERRPETADMRSVERSA